MPPLTQAVGEAGVLGMLGVFVLAETMAIITVLSFSAIVTNGTVRGGGSYYLISRSLGPELGGAIGILFYFAYAVGTSFYVIGFATAVQQTWFASSSHWVTTGIGAICLVVILAISTMGAEAFSRFNIWFFAIQMLSIVLGEGVSRCFLFDYSLLACRCDQLQLLSRKRSGRRRNCHRLERHQLSKQFVSILHQG